MILTGEPGAYGFRVLGLEGARHLLVPSPAGYPSLRIAVEAAVPEDRREEFVGERHALVRLRTGGHLAVDRDAGLARFRVEQSPGPEELVHPYLAPAASIAAHWLGRTCFHGGAVLAEDGVWGVIGDREHGKSTLLAWLAGQGTPIVADDALVLDGRTCFAGPRSVDLRQEAAGRLGIGAAAPGGGRRERFRVVLPQIAPELPFRGWIFLAWADTPELEAVSASQCLAALMANVTLRVTGRDPAALLALAALPARRFARPRSWERLGDDAELLMGGIRDMARLRPAVA